MSPGSRPRPAPCSRSIRRDEPGRLPRCPMRARSSTAPSATSTRLPRRCARCIATVTQRTSVRWTPARWLRSGRKAFARTSRETAPRRSKATRACSSCSPALRPPTTCPGSRNGRRARMPARATPLPRRWPQHPAMSKPGSPRRIRRLRPATSSTRSPFATRGLPRAPPMPASSELAVAHTSPAATVRRRPKASRARCKSTWRTARPITTTASRCRCSGTFADAARAYQRALAFRPDLVAADFNLGVLFQEQGRPTPPIAAYRRGAGRGSGATWPPTRILGEVLLAAGRIDAWLANFRRFEAHCPDALPLAVQALEACQLSGRLRGARALSRRPAPGALRRADARPSSSTPGGAALPAAVFRRRAGRCCTLRAHVRRGRAARLRRAAPRRATGARGRAACASAIFRPTFAIT